MNAWYKFQIKNGDWWQVPVEVIAQDRAFHYANEFGGDIQQSMAEDTIPHFQEDEYNVADWARNNMNWSQVRPFAEKIESGEIEWEDEWANPQEYSVIWKEEPTP